MSSKHAFSYCDNVKPCAFTPESPLLELILEADPLPHNPDPNVHPLTGKRLIPLHLLQADFHLSPPLKPMGRIGEDVLLEMIAFEQHRHFPLFSFFPRLSDKVVVPSAVRCVSFDLALVKQGKEALSLGMEALVWYMRSRGTMKNQTFPREDIYSIFADPRSLAFADRQSEMSPWDNIALTLVRACAVYLGTPWIGVSMIVYEGEGEDLKVWVQKRAAAVYHGGMLDTTAGGAVETERTAWEGMSKEAEEEAKLSGEMVRKYGSFEGGLNFYLDPNNAPKPRCKTTSFIERVMNLTPSLCFDLKRPDQSSPDYDATLPQICDDEVEAFIIQQGLQGRKFQPSAVPDLIFFLHRKGFITRETEPELDAVLARCQRPHDVAFPHRLLDF